jgi:hypothetical protein
VGQPLATNNCKGSPREAINSFNEHSDTPKAQAERCRRLAAATYNREMSEILDNMADGFERTAGELSKKSET